MWFKDDVVPEGREHARRFEADGEVWLVYEVGPPYDRRGPSLVFETERVVRRVRNYPEKWRHLSDEELLLLKEQV